MGPAPGATVDGGSRDERVASNGLGAAQVGAT